MSDQPTRRDDAEGRGGSDEPRAEPRADAGPFDDAEPRADAGPFDDAEPRGDAGPFDDAEPRGDAGPFDDAEPRADAEPFDDAGPFDDAELDATERRLRGIVAAVDPVPDVVLAAARAAFATRDLDARLADLVADSWSSGAVLTRDDAGPRMLTFRTSGDVSGAEIEVDVESVQGGSRLHGIVAGLGSLVVVHRSGRLDVPLSPDGRFDVGPVPAGPVRLEGVGPDGVRVATAWLTT